MQNDRYSLEYEIREEERRFGVCMGEEASIDGPPQFELETGTYEGSVGESRMILRRIYDAIEEREEEDNGVYPRVIILGIEEYMAVDSYLRYDGDDGIEDQFSCDIYVVPGRMIHIPKKNEFVPSAYFND